MELIAIQFLSVRVPSGRIVTLHTGNRVELDAADAQYLLAEYPDRVRVESAPAESAPAPVTFVGDTTAAETDTDTDTDASDTDAPKAKRKPTKK